MNEYAVLVGRSVSDVGRRELLEADEKRGASAPVSSRPSRWSPS